MRKWVNGDADELAALVPRCSFTAVATSFIGFVLGLEGFLSDAWRLPGGQRHLGPFVATLVPPLVLSLALRDVFFSALDTAGTYGVMTLFGIFPPILAFVARSRDSCPDFQLVPGGNGVLAVVAGAAAAIILNKALP